MDNERKPTFRQTTRSETMSRSLGEMEKDIKKSKKDFAKALDQANKEIHSGLDKVLFWMFLATLAALGLFIYVATNPL
jgi:hypothetical protein